uniref:Uncharacterized protein n=1 Tax=Anopheles atroparvus TaxID=41427 RepID=A0AAG5CN58_ANOAO
DAGWSVASPWHVPIGSVLDSLLGLAGVSVQQFLKRNSFEKSTKVFVNLRHTQNCENEVKVPFSLQRWWKSFKKRKRLWRTKSESSENTKGRRKQPLLCAHPETISVVALSS